MGKRKMMREMLKREIEHYNECEVGSDEYVKSQARIKELVKETEGLNNETTKVILQGIETGARIVVPIGCFAAVLAFEKNDSFSSSMKQILKCFVPRGLF